MSLPVYTVPAMPLSPGTRLGPYEILSAIGAGGMGEVYKARDTRLDRAVALKVIQSAVAGLPEMRERFEREARAISALDHPHICILYDVCREADVSFLVMQYLEGETLADRLARAGKPLSDPSRPASGSETAVSTMTRGPIPFDTALKYAAEIATALDAAHRRGIVHRDLKPGNVMLTKGGTKLLDFGLAKLASGDNASGIAGFGEGATRTRPLTSQGAILGTLHYMSPEQLEGRDVDARSDIHAFGALLFEMLSGRRAFDGQSQAGIIAAIISADPPPLTSLADPRTSLPVVAQRALDRLTGRCLAKNPDDRWQSAADLAAELNWINEERLRAVPETTAAAPAAATSGSRTRERVWMGVAAAAIVALGGIAVMWYPRAALPPAPVSFTVDAPEGETLSGGPGLLEVSPDGSRVAFVTGRENAGNGGQLWVRAVGSLVPQRIDRAVGAWQPAWTPDGRAIIVSASGGSAPLLKIDLSGGAPTTLAPSAIGRAAVSPSGVVLFEAGGLTERSLYRVSDAGGQPVVAMALDPSRQETALEWPSFLPDGRRYLFLARSTDPSKSAIFLGSLDAPSRTLLVNAQSNVDYAAGHLFYQRDGTLMAHPFDADAGRLTGDAFPVVENIRFNTANGRAAFSVSRSGVIAYVPGTDIADTSGRQIMLFDRSGKGRQIGAAGSYGGGTLSPDGRQAMITLEPGLSGIRSLSLLDLERGVLTRFTVGSADERLAIWSPDGAMVYFQSTRDGKIGIYRRQAGGGATTDEALMSGPEPLTPTSISSDNQRLLFTRGTGPGTRIWMLPLSGDRKPVEVFPGSTTSQQMASFSPDDKWIAYVETTGPGPNASDVYLQPYPADGRRIRISTASGRHPQWMPDNRQIVYRASNDAIMSVTLTAADGTLRPSTPVQLFTRRRQASFNWQLSMDDRGERFLLVAPPETAVEPKPPPITVIVNFAQSVAKKGS
jgi:serine/threonine protein kinase/Tol biopolymer transport system component